MGNNVRLGTLHDFVRHHYDVAVDCQRCMHGAVFDARTLAAYFRERNINVALEVIIRRFRCKHCGSRDVTIKPRWKPECTERPKPAAPSPIVDENVPMGIDPVAWHKADYYERKRLIRRARG